MSKCEPHFESAETTRQTESAIAFLLFLHFYLCNLRFERPWTEFCKILAKGESANVQKCKGGLIRVCRVRNGTCTSLSNFIGPRGSEQANTKVQRDAP